MNPFYEFEDDIEEKGQHHEMEGDNKEESIEEQTEECEKITSTVTGSEDNDLETLIPSELIELEETFPKTVDEDEKGTVFSFSEEKEESKEQLDVEPPKKSSCIKVVLITCILFIWMSFLLYCYLYLSTFCVPVEVRVRFLAPYY